jgi:hypothetical protein
MTKKITMDDIRRLESLQAKISWYNTTIGKILLYFLPVILIGISVFTILENMAENPPFEIKLVFILVLVLFAINTLVLASGAFYTRKSFFKRLEYERQKGRPLDSLRGFKTIESNIMQTLRTITLLSLVSFVTLGIYIPFIVFGGGSLAWIATGVTLITLGLGLAIKSVKMDITSVVGLSDFFRPSNHELFIDKFFGDIFMYHLDPVTRLKWDEFVDVIETMLTPEFVQSIREEEEGEIPVSFAIEKLLYLCYLEHSKVISHEIVKDELQEIMDLTRKQWDLDKGTLIDGRYYFSSTDFFKIFNVIKQTTPSFFAIIDRLQLELVDNIKIMAEDPIYLDVAANELVAEGDEAHIIVFLYNNTPADKPYMVKILAPGFEPEELSVLMSVEGRGGFELPQKSLPLISNDTEDVIGLMARLLKNGDALWLTLEPRKRGTQTVQILLTSEAGTIIEGKTMTVSVFRDLIAMIKGLSSKLSVLGGVAAPVLKQFLGL